MSDWKTIDSPTWKKILQHRFFIAVHKDLYIEDLLNEIAKTVFEQDQKIENALKGIEEWCSDCLKPKHACPSCIYQLTKEELGYRPRLSRGESTIDSDKDDGKYEADWDEERGKYR